MTATLYRLSDYRPRPLLQVVPIEETRPSLENVYAEVEKAGDAVERAQAVALAHVVRLWFMGWV